MVTGYKHRNYAESLAEFGTPRILPRSGGWVLQREISESPYCDAMGCYPLFACEDWSQLRMDLEEVGKNLVSLSLVADPFGNYDLSYLRQCFVHIVIPFKEHFVIDLSQPPDAFVSKHHSHKAHKAFQKLRVERCETPQQFVGDWVSLYAHLIKRKNITGIRAFSEKAFTRQFDVPGIVVFRSVFGGKTVGMLLWYMDHEVAYYHLGASSPVGRDLCASFALFWFAIEYFAVNRLRWLDIGATAGLQCAEPDGLRQFKQGWSTGSRTVYFCGRIFDLDRYTQIVKAKGVQETDYFPAYRRGEFA